MNIEAIYQGSDGDLTRRLYARLDACGAAGDIAKNLLRASKSSSRAKVYRGGVRGVGSYKDMAYLRKQWSMENLCKALTFHAEQIGIRWGWKIDPAQQFHKWVLYVELPTGQVSFHTAGRGEGPDFPGEWDGVRDVSASRIIRWAEVVLDEERQEALF